MERNSSQNERDIVDLGAVSIETKGNFGSSDDTQGKLNQGGLSND